MSRRSTCAREKKEPNLKRMAIIAANILPTIREQGILTPLIVDQDLVLEPYGQQEASQ